MDRQPDGIEEKKLIDAARYWVGGDTSYAEAINDLKAFSAPEEVIQELLDLQANADFEVFEENWPVIEMFLRVQTQWRVGMAGLIGLDYSILKWMFDVYGVDDHKEMMDCLIIMERSVIAAMNEEK